MRYRELFLYWGLHLMQLQGKVADFSVVHSVEATLTPITLLIQYYYLNKYWKISNRIIHSNTNLV